MKKSLVLCLQFFVISIGWSQSVDYNKIILPDNSKDVSIEERLVQLAWKNNPASAIAENDLEIGKAQLAKAKWSWLDHINITGNLNEFTIQGRDETDPQNRNNFYPRYNFGIGFSLGTFASTPLNIKMAKEGMQNDGERIKILKLKIRADVLRRYSHYQTSKELYDIQKEFFDNLEASFKLVETKFERGEATLNEYNGIRDRYDAQRIKIITAENTLMLAKIDLEEYIGLKLEEII